MENKQKNGMVMMLREAGILFAITLIAGLGLGIVNELTKEPIRIQKEMAVQRACSAVFEAADSFKEVAYTPGQELAEELSAMGVRTGSTYSALGKDGAVLGYVVESISTQGYAGNIVLYVGVALDGTLNDVSILEIKETPGLGMLAPQVLIPQFHGKNVESFVYTKEGASAENEIDAITGATITTNAVTNAVNGGLKVARALAGTGGGGDE